MFSTEQVDYLNKHFDERYKEMFVHVSECNEKQTEVNKNFAKDDKRIDMILDKLNLWGKLLWAIATSSIGALVIAFFELILK